MVFPFFKLNSFLKKKKRKKKKKEIQMNVKDLYLYLFYKRIFKETFKNIFYKEKC